MGKIEDQPRIPDTGIETSNPSCPCSLTWLPGIGKAFTFRCLAVLILAAGLFLSAAFWLPFFRSDKSGFDSADVQAHAAPVQASFRLQKPVSLLSVYTSRLERELLDEIGVPNAKVSLISMHPLDSSNWTYVVFGVLANRRDVPITPVALSILRSCLVELVLQRSNLSLTPSIFGQPSSFEVLKFPEEITVVPTQPSSIWLKPEILFNFTLNNSVSQIQENLSHLKGQLKYGLQLRSYESVYVEVTNLEGSTLAPPVIIQSAVLFDGDSRGLLLGRLKQLAEAITGSPVKNLGLDHSVFGKVKQIQLSQCLKKSLEALSPTPSPSPSHSPAPTPSPSMSMENSFSAPPISHYPKISPSFAPPPSAGHYSISPCLDCDASSPSSSTFPPVSTPRNEPQPPSPPSSISPVPAVVTVPHSIRHGSCSGPTVSPKTVTKRHSAPPTSSYFSPRPAVPPQHQPTKPAPHVDPDISPSSAIHYGSSQRQDQKFGIASVSSIPASSPISPLPSSYVAGP
ncbi:inverted formin-2 [Cinnamomum micranthum f. kanehirae]|uniref:Inverted formin-2 n=1 Tax=Cinnamomum micranthum f. kanehirae TaxID=337451 RepID=A0A443PQ31_9MAGN|nr:inverted formin-2 [Cinnamomum micranthum f. kanehirae]